MSSHRALHIPELLKEVLQYTSKHKYRSLALVCKDWSEVVLDYKWREVAATELFKVLRPSLFWENGQYCISQPISSDCWTRFLKYHYRIRVIHCYNPPIHPSVYTIIGRERPYSGPVLPNLTSFRGAPDPVPAQLFACPSITSFSLGGQSETNHRYELVLQNLPVWAPNLETLSLFDTPDDQSLQDALIEVFPSLRSIHKLDIPMKHLTHDIIEVVSQLPLLSWFKGCGPVPHTYDLGSLSNHLRSGSFPALEHLQLDACLEQFRTFLQSWVPPTSLKILSLVEYTAVLPENYPAIIEWVASHAPWLESLSIGYEDRELIESIGQYDDPLPFSVFEPLFSLKHLSSLTISYPIPFTMREDELVALATALPVLRHLDIGTIDPPCPDSRPSLCLSALSSIAPLCTALESLCIYLAFFEGPLRKVKTPSVPFKSLASLAVGYSPIRRPISVSLFLSRILPDSCELDYTPLDGHADEERVQEWGEAALVLEVTRITRREMKKNCNCSC